MKVHFVGLGCSALADGLVHIARSIIVGLLNRDPARRLGNNGGEEIKRHPFFSRYIDWNR